MPDRENVISKIKTICEICKENKWIIKFTSDVIYPILSDALALLKEQQQQIWEFQDQVEYLTDKLKEQEETEFCERCGRRRVKSNREVK